MTGIGQGFVARSVELTLSALATSRRLRPRVGVLRSIGAAISLVAGMAWTGVAGAEPAPLVLQRDGSVIVLEPYAPNIVRVSLSLDRAEAMATPGYGFVAAPSAEGWTHEQSEEGDVYRSPRLVVVVAGHPPHTPPATQIDIARFFSGSPPPPPLTIPPPPGKRLFQMGGWSMSVSHHND